MTSKFTELFQLYKLGTEAIELLKKLNNFQLNQCMNVLGNPYFMGANASVERYGIHNMSEFLETYLFRTCFFISKCSDIVYLKSACGMLQRVIDWHQLLNTDVHFLARTSIATRNVSMAAKNKLESMKLRESVYQLHRFLIFV